jgi:hypothetical protein
MKQRGEMKRRELKTPTGSTGAIFSDCETYRYLLWRVWDDSLRRALLLMLNPSTANEVENDPTVERQIRRVLMWPQIGFPFNVGGLEVANAFAYRETDSTKLASLNLSGSDLVGPDNDAMILDASRRATVVVCGWGQPGLLGGRGDAVLRLLRAAGIKPYGLQMNRDGTPKHPLYVRYETIPIEIPTSKGSTNVRA